jgi:4-amino-4-deoxy-L-arabinose transferase-like glycosyltransferase
VLLRPRRLPSVFVAAGLTIAGGGLVVMSGGLTEAYLSFFVVAAALALYRDWAPFGVFLVGTLAIHVAHDHQSAMAHPWAWVLAHGIAVLAAVAFHVLAWRLSETQERRA